MTRTCAIYARATPDQRIDAQLDELRQFAKQQDFELAFEYKDVGVSSKARRPGLDAMLKDARNKRFDAVLVAGYDGLACSTKHLISVVCELEGLGVVFMSRRENIATDSATGQLFLTVIRSIAEFEADLLKERIRAGMRRRRQDGLHVGRRPLDVDHEALVRDRLSGMSLTDVAKRYGVSRASVVRWVREARQTNPALSTTSQPIREFTREVAA
jgi:DNA invertase Pin-like site-specific DNA recombinase